jgi:hypothetical protein
VLLTCRPLVEENVVGVGPAVVVLMLVDLVVDEVVVKVVVVLTVVVLVIKVVEPTPD